MSGSPLIGDSPRILIVKLSAIGDLIHALPVLNALRALRPNAHISWACQQPAANILLDHPQLDRLVLLPRRINDARKHGGWRAVLGDLRGPQPYDAAIDLQGLTKSGVVCALSGAKRRVGLGGKNSRELNRLFVHQRTPARSPITTS